jgi:hypothetical protein
MSEVQMKTFKKQLIEFKSILAAADSDTQTTMAGMRLRSIFGDFPTS